MIRVCPKCGDYYADEQLSFCCADGTPLVSVHPNTKAWEEGTRVVERKHKAASKRQRRLKWRRIVMSVVTVVITMAVLSVVIINGVIYLKPAQDSAASTPTPTPTETETPTPTPTPTITPTPTPTPTPSPTPTPTRKVTSTDTQTPTEDCSAADQKRERKVLEEMLRLRISNAPPKDLVRLRPSLAFKSVDVRLSGTCETAGAKIRFEWRVEPSPTNQGVTIPGEKSFACSKIRKSWSCR